LSAIIFDIKLVAAIPGDRHEDTFLTQLQYTMYPTIHNVWFVVFSCMKHFIHFIHFIPPKCTHPVTTLYQSTGTGNSNSF
jgi:hypothetical protein